jgi:hypothetical protein
MSAASEVSLAFLQTLRLLTPQRNLMLTYMAWTMLKTRYWSPEGASAHRSVSG